MKISNILIEKFRSIKKCKVNLNEINAIVGENNSGKTAILRAINVLFHFEDEMKYFIDNTHRYSVRANTKIEVVFSDVPNKSIYHDKVDNGKVTLGFKYVYSSNKKSLYFKFEGKEINCEDSFLEEIKKDIDYLYIPASRSNYDLNWADNSIFKKLIHEFSKEYTTSRDTVSKHVIKASEKLNSSIFGKIEKQLSDLFPTSEKYKFSIGYSKDVDYTLLLENLVLKMSEKSNLYPVSEYGSGIKSLTIISIFRAIASMYGCNIVLGIEEPETNLHPQMQKQFISKIKNDKKNHEIQLILATHSTVIIDELRHEDIIMVRREVEESRGFYSVVTQLSNDFWTTIGIEGFKHYQFFNYRNSDFFFSKYIVITESKTDSQVFAKLISKELGWKMAFVSIISLDGVKNLKYPFYLLRELNLPFSIIVDRDFFTAYLNDNLENSRGDDGLPIYKNILNNDDIINTILEKNEDKTNLLKAFESGVYTKVFDILRRNKIYTMQYCLDMDLTCSDKICSEYFRLLNMPCNQQNQKELLIGKKKAIKNIENILEVLENVQVQNYPISLKKIKKSLIEDINQYV